MEPETIEESKLITISCRTLRVSFQKFRKISKFSVEEVPVPGGGGLPYGTDGDARRKSLTPKGDHLGVAQAFCDP